MDGHLTPEFIDENGMYDGQPYGYGYVHSIVSLKIPGFFKPQNFYVFDGMFNFDKHSDTLFMKLNKWRNIWIFLLEIHF